MSMKQTIKSAIPQPIWNRLRRMKNAMRLSQAGRVQARRFRRWMSREDSTDKARVETRLAFDIQRLEKGLSHVSFRYGFGKGVLREIAKRMTMLEKADSAYAANPLYLQGLAAVGEYKRRHAGLGAADVFLEIVMQPFLGFDDIVPDSSSPATV